MAVFCAGVMCTNYVGVNVLSPIKATSTVNGNVYEYTSENNSFCITKNGELVNRIRANGNVEMKQCNVPFVGCNVAAVVAKGATTVAAGTTIAQCAATAGAAAWGAGPTTAEIALLGVTGAVQAVATVTLVFAGVGALIG